mgnify:CR=1 FL=1
MDGIDAEDEHGNSFKRKDLTSYRRMVGDEGDWSHNDADFPARLLPGQTDESAMFYEMAPPISKQITISVQVGDRVIRFHGPIGSKESLDNAEALKAKAGQVLDAGDLLKALAAGSKTVKTDYPVGCAMRAVGKVSSKRDNGGVALILDCGSGVGGRGSEGVYCYMADRTLYDKVKPGDIVSLQGVLRRAEGSGPTLVDCVGVVARDQPEAQPKADDPPAKPPKPKGVLDESSIKPPVPASIVLESGKIWTGTLLELSKDAIRFQAKNQSGASMTLKKEEVQSLYTAEGSYQYNKQSGEWHLIRR